MRGRRLACALAATAIVASLGGAAAAAQTISDLTMDLQNLQVRIAAGDKAAYASQAERISAIGAAIVAAKPEVWQSKRETDAAVIYLFSGGQPRDIVRLVESGAVPASPRCPYVGAAYAMPTEQHRIRASRLPESLAEPKACCLPVAYAMPPGGRTGSAVSWWLGPVPAVAARVSSCRVPARLESVTAGSA